MTKDWVFHKKRIIELYKTEGMTLEQVREYMIREWNFKAGYAPSSLPPFVPLLYLLFPLLSSALPLVHPHSVILRGVICTK